MWGSKVMVFVCDHEQSVVDLQIRSGGWDVNMKLQEKRVTTNMNIVVLHRDRASLRKGCTYTYMVMCWEEVKQQKENVCNKVSIVLCCCSVEILNTM